MPVCSSWIHGNALVVESPDFVDPQGEKIGRLTVTPFGWGAQVSGEGHSVASWMHVPIPTVDWNAGRFERFNLVRVFLLVECADSSIDQVHVYDGRTKVAEFSASLEGNHLTKDLYNTFSLKTPHPMKTGVGLSFHYTQPTPLDRDPSTNPPPSGTLWLAAAGAEFETGSTFFAAFTGQFLRRGP